MTTQLALPNLQPRMARRRNTEPQDRVTSRPKSPKLNDDFKAARTNIPLLMCQKISEQMAGSEQA
jgi:hypothetical protein